MMRRFCHVRRNWDEFYLPRTLICCASLRNDKKRGPLSRVSFSPIKTGAVSDQVVEDLFLLATYCDPDELANKVTYLPLR